MRNPEVVERFFQRKPGKARHLRSDGESLWSYWTRIGWWEGDELVSDVRFYSFTTSMHQWMLWQWAERRFWPVAGESPPTVEEMREAAMVMAARNWWWSGKYLTVIARRNGECEQFFLPRGVADAVFGGKKTALVREPLATYLLAYMETRDRRLARAIGSGDIERMRRAFILLLLEGEV